MTIQKTVTLAVVCDTDVEYNAVLADLQAQAPAVTITAQDAQARTATAERQETAELPE